MTIAGISNEAVLKKTRKGWNEWIQLLEDAGADQWKHKQIALYLYEHHGLDGWWAQMVTVGFEQARGLREKHQTPKGYEISVSKTFQVPADKLFNAWAEGNVRKQWLPEYELQISKSTPSKSIRAVLQDQTRVSIEIYKKGDDRCQLFVQHMKLTDSPAAERSKLFWKSALERLKTHCES